MSSTTTERNTEKKNGNVEPHDELSSLPRLSKGTKNPNKGRQYCTEEYSASLQCISDNYVNKDEACRTQFDTYNNCKKEQSKARADAKRLQESTEDGKKGGFFGFW